MLEEHRVEYRYREYREEPLSEDELRSVLGMLSVGAREVLRARDAKRLGLAGDEPDDVLIPLMAAHPTLLQRPIGVLAGRAVVGRPPERILELLADGSS